MSTEKRKFELFARLQRLGFTYDEASQLRRIEMTLSRWSEAECNGDIQREGDQCDGKPFRVYEHSSSARHYPVADREAGALRRLKAIIDTRNAREDALSIENGDRDLYDEVISYHQGDPRGCSLYLLKASQLMQDGKALPVDSHYSRGLAVCA